MRSTRSKTGMLPAKVIPFGAPILEGEVVDAAIEKIEEAGDGAAEEAEIEDQIEDVVDTGMQAGDVITTFNSKQPIEDGAYIIRSLGKGKFELVNVQHVRREVLGSVEFGTILKSNPERFALVETVKGDLESIKGNIVQAMDSANNNIFRFLNLSLELRYMIYDLTVKSSRVLRYSADANTSGFSFRGVNKQIRDETAPFFWSNNFMFIEEPRGLKMEGTFDLAYAHITEVTFDWWAMARKDKRTVEAIAKCTNLKVLNLAVTKYAINPVIHDWRPKLVWTGTPEDRLLDRIPKFNKSKAIDALCRLRGLTKVNVMKCKGTCGPQPGQVTQEELDELEDFLNEKMTQPVIPQVVSSRQASNTRKTNGKRKSKGYRDADEDDSDYETGAKRRRAKTKRRISWY